MALHRCDNPACVRAEADPATSHIFIGTHTDNMRDMERKGRANKAFGERHHSSKLTAEQAREILAARGMMSGPALARRYGVTHGTVYRIMSGRGWRRAIAKEVPSGSL
jgi:hypothetical protein